MKKLQKGDFVKVGKDIGVVVLLENESEIPEEHLGIWYGEITIEGKVLYRTVPVDYCEKIENIEAYH